MVEPQSEQCVEGYGATANTPSSFDDYLVNLRFINNCSTDVTIEDVEISFHDITTGNCVQKCYRKDSGYVLTPGESDLIGEHACNVDPDTDTDPCSNDPLVPGEYLLVYKLKINGEWKEVKERTVEVLGSSTGDSFEPDNSSSAANTINTSFSQNHSIIPEDDEDWLKFTLNSPSNITIETTGESGDTELWLYDDSLTQINYDDNGGTDNFSKISQEELAAGTYFIKVDEYGNNDTISLYNVRLTVDPLLNSSSFSWNLFLPAILVGSADSITAINGISQEQWFAERAKSKGTEDWSAVEFSAPYVTLYQDRTDNGPSLTSIGFKKVSGKKLKITRTALMHSHISNSYMGGDEFFTSVMGIYESDSSGRKGISTLLNLPPLCKVHYMDYEYQRDWDNFIFNDSNDSSNFLPSVWDADFEETFIYNPENGEASYEMNGNRVEAQCEPLTLEFLKIYINTYGWWTGHYTKIKSFKLEWID
ncbi:MAG: hypothetical protein D3911_15925 [Candidatus Electrothrix sp. AW3_4]|nr:hypothetical protein [Candidatus Electrothrix gigas]